ncbi:MAG: transglutaminase family protein [Deltaproteobacteria bacterium]|nr:transglutaminase family protein [Deltaproteobacteria bacterium]
MIFRISHKTNYSYSAPVFLEPHIIHLTPRNDGCQKISNFFFAVEPQPAGMHHYLDAEGNNTVCIWFEEKTAGLSISTSFEAQTFCMNPFGYFVIDNDFLKLPAIYEKNDQAALKPFLSSIDIDSEVTDFGKSIFENSNGVTLEFLSRLCMAIYENFKVETRECGPPFSPVVTFQNKRGACRDLVILFMAVCRNFGLATRFVSGYQEGDPDMDQRHLHAWAEVYIPGGGWRGYDPSHGLVVADRHIALAASHDPAGTAPVKGNFRGTGVSATTNYLISLSAVSDKQK